MRYGICTGLENLELVKKLGYDYIEPSVTSIMKWSEDEMLSWTEKLESAEIRCEAFNILFPKTMQLLRSDLDWAEVNDYLDQAFSRVHSLGGTIVVFGSGKCRNCAEDQSFSDAYKRLINIIQKTAGIAEHYGITIAIEPLNRTETNMICTMKEGAMVCVDVNCSNVKLLADYFHVATDQDHLEDMLVIKEFSHIHIASGNGRRYPLSEQDENYRKLFESLAKVGYQGRMSIEGKTECMKEDGETALHLLKSLEAETYGES